MDVINQLKKEVQKLKSKTRCPRYPQEVKDLALTALSSGFTRHQLRKATGINLQTLIAWQSKNDFRKVRVTKAAAPVENLKFVFPNGCWVEGLSIAAIKELVKATGNALS